MPVQGEVAPPAAAAVRAVEAQVDPRVELLTVVARLGGFREFTMGNSRSPYSERVERHFGAQREHAVVKRLVALRAERGVSYDAIPSLALHLGPLPELAELVPFDAAPERLDARWGGTKAREFLTELRDFARVTKAAEFFESERQFHAEVARRLSERLSQSRALPWFDSFFGARPGARYTATAGLLCGGGNFGVGVRFPDGRPESINPVFGCWTWDVAGFPVFDESYLPLFVHELCHTYTNPFVDRFERELAASGQRIHASCAAAMQRQGYGTWKTMVYETFVRASVVRCRRATEGDAAAAEQAAEEVKKQFVWVPALEALLVDYEADRKKYPSFDAFVPRIVELLEREAAKLPDPALAPKLVALEPANGASDVDPALTRLVIRFDRAMLDQAWSLVGSKEQMPEITGPLAYDAERKVLTVPVRLEPGRTYTFSLNSERNQGFKSADGVPLSPVPVQFSTAKR
ncbi:MAG: DUF4932 domain-containing protein [Planctomycetota bacterium]|nr:DUF4932 domain-containing protein [Planctomycetota bacterium]